jgi:hypothetical protein
MPIGKVKTIMIPPELEKKIQQYCKKYGLTRSEFIRNCVIEKLEVGVSGNPNSA